MGRHSSLEVSFSPAQPDDDPNLAPQMAADGNFQFNPSAGAGGEGGDGAGMGGSDQKPFEF